MRSWTVAKGHGTENDFVVINDRHGMLDPSPADVRYLCDRRAGIGGDGLLRAIKAEHMPEWDGDPGLWFMDYRNADGSISEMCGNGVRVFARYLADEGLVETSTIPIATRAGLREAVLGADGQIRVDMGEVTLGVAETTVTVDGRDLAAWPADVGNPHAVAFVDDVADFDLHHAPRFDPAVFPHGVNIEIVQPVGPGHVRMRVHERGVGETRSCGTGTVAVAAASAKHLGGSDHWRVDVPGGTLRIDLGEGDGARTAAMTGPAVIVMTGQVHLPDPSDD
ncbi:diaminopimelate epimerase [Mariniluteicoccus endophyticus]